MDADLDCNGKRLDLSRPNVMGVLNVTPDSFSDGGRYLDCLAALGRAWKMVEEGASIIDVGGESTRPAAEPVTADQELDRVIPVIESLVREGLPVPISIDTSKPEVMRAAAAAGAGMINDVRALRAPGAVEAAREANVPVCLMHMQGEPRTMQQEPSYVDVVAEVEAFLQERLAACVDQGIPTGRVLLDPGIGFGKFLHHNLSLLRHLGRFCELGRPVVVGLSRKRMVGEIVGAGTERRLYGSLAGAVVAAWQGAAIVRVHDVRASVEALAVCGAIRRAP